MTDVTAFEDTLTLPRRHRYKLINVTQNHDHLDFELQRGDGGFSPAGKTPIQDRAQLRKRVASLLETMASRLAAGPEDERTRVGNFRAEAESLFTHLIPESLRKCVREWSPGTCVGITTNEAWVPWELLHDTHDYLWQKFLLFRLPKLSLNPDQELDDSEQSFPTAADGYGSATSERYRVIHVVGGGLSRSRVDALTQALSSIAEGCHVILLAEKNGDTVIDELNGAHVIHFDCHGRADPPRLRTGSSETPELQLKLTLVEGSTCRLRRGCLVFANACESDAPELSFATDRSFGRAFYAKGASAFLGTLGTVPEGPAFAFADAFYQALAGAAKGDVSEAFWLARKTARAHPVLVYVFYGNPLKIPALW